jgi:hypothetical protein
MNRIVSLWPGLAIIGLGLAGSSPGFGQTSPELAMRDFSSGQIKKGVRSIGFGGDGATWGNYGLVWKDAASALADYGDTSYSNGNDFHFEAIGVTTPPLWHDLAIYLIAMTEGTNDVRLSLRSPGLGPGATPVVGSGSDAALFSKIALPLGYGVSAGILLSYERSHFDASSIAAPGDVVRYQTSWRPSGGFGIAWQPGARLLFGFRALLNNDLEQRSDPAGTSNGYARSAEYRLGASVSPWTGALIDVGATRLDKRNEMAGTHSVTHEPNVGFEQALFSRHLTLRIGVDETSPTAGFSLRVPPLNVDVAYVRNMARSRVDELFGAESNSILATFTLDYDAIRQGR